MSEGKVMETTNYGKFKDIRGNRGINQRYLSKLAESVKSNNLLPQNPIIVNERMQVIDGQHRLKVAEILGVSIFYTVVKSGSLADVQMLNTNIRQWTMLDFLESYIAVGKEDYSQLKDFSEKNGISVSNSLVILTGGFYIGESKGNRLEQFRNGDFKVTQKEYANLFVRRLRDLRKYLEEKVDSDREFLKSLEKTYKVGFSHKTLMEKFEKSGIKITRASGYKEYIRQLEDVLSYHSNRILRIPIKGKAQDVATV